VCWLVPAVIVAVNAGKQYLGFHTIGSTGKVLNWCRLLHTFHYPMLYT